MLFDDEENKNHIGVCQILLIAQLGRKLNVQNKYNFSKVQRKSTAFSFRKVTCDD